MDRDRLGEPAHATGLDVDDPARAERDHVLRAVEGGDRLVEAERCDQLPLQLGVAHEIVPGERLFDHHEAELVEACQVRCVGERVGVVGVGHEVRVLTHRGAHGAHPVDVTPRCDLDLHLLVPFGDRRLGLGDERMDVALDAERDAGGDLFARSSDQSRERKVRLDGGQAPAAHLECGLGHVVPAHVLVEYGVHVTGTFDALAEQSGREHAHEGRPGGIERLGRVVGLVVHDALAPAARTVGVEEFAEEDAAFAHLAGGDAERLAEREADLAEDDAVECDHRVNR